MKILFGGPGFRWSSTEARRRALVALGHEVHAIDVQSFVDPSSRLLPKLRRHLNLGGGIAAYNESLLAEARVFKPDLVWLDLPVQVWPRTVRALASPGRLVVNHNSEYLGFLRYWFRHLLSAASLYDAHIVTNELTADILKARGARRIINGEFAYDPLLHRPMPLTPAEADEYAADAVFVGHWEPTTEKRVAQLRRKGVRVAVYGQNWRRALRLADRKDVRPLYGEAYVKSLLGAKICLGFLSRWNHNQATLRTFEIPATGGFLLADRTALHRSYFEEGKEAEFFSSVEELVAKCQYYIGNTHAREAVARAGWQRCVQSAHTHVDEVKRILTQLFGEAAAP